MINSFILLMQISFSSPCVEAALNGLNSANYENRFDHTCYQPEEQSLKSFWTKYSKLYLKCPDPVEVYKNDTTKIESDHLRNSAVRCSKIGDSTEAKKKKDLDSAINAHEKLLAIQIAGYKGGFPGNIGLDDSKESLDEIVISCTDLEIDIGTESCDLTMDSSMSFKISTFEASEYNADFYPDPKSKLTLPYQITITSQGFEDCDDAVTAKAEISAAILAKYGKGKSVITRKGPKFGSNKCRDYMKESLSEFVVKNDYWQYRIDSYWYKGEFFVYTKYQFLPRLQIVNRMLSKIKRAEIIDGLEKL